MPKVAVGSSDGLTIDVHFGQAEFFFIYEIGEDGNFTRLEKRLIDPGSLERKIEQLSDVKVVLIRFIGQHAADRLLAQGIQYFAVDLPVEKALQAYARRGKLLSLPEPGNGGEAPPRREDCPLRALKQMTSQ
jgi:nitrogen fixation protein NifB